MKWNKVKISDFLINRDGRYKPNDKKIKGLKRIDKIDFSGHIYISEKPSKTDMILIKKGDLVISGINVEKGAMNIYEGDEDLTATIHYSSYMIVEEKIDLEFLKSFLKSPEFKDAIKDQVPGGIKTEIKPKHLLSLEIEIPESVNDQKSIVKSLNISNSLIQNLKSETSQQLELLKKLKQQILQDAVQGKLVKQDPKDEPASVLLEKIKAEKEKLIKEKKLKPDKPLPPIKEEEIPFQIPDSWEWCRLGDICTKITDGFHNTPLKLNKGKIYISATHIKESGINWEECLYISEKNHNELYSKAYPKQGEILIVNRGAGCGIPSIIDIEHEFSFQNCALIGFNQSLINNKYIYHLIVYMRSIILLNFVNGGLQPMLSNIILSKMPIPLPSISEQISIVTKIESLMKKCAKLEESIKQGQKNTEQLMQSVLRDALKPEGSI